MVAVYTQQYIDIVMIVMITVANVLNISVWLSVKQYDNRKWPTYIHTYIRIFIIANITLVL